MTDALKQKYLEQFAFDGVRVSIDTLTAPYVGAVDSVKGLITLKVGNVFKKETRKPVNISLVLDASGSMDGQKLVNCKKALISILENMIEGDCFHLIKYSNDASIVIKDIHYADRENAKEVVNNLTVNGSTNLHAGFMLGADVAKVMAPDFSGRSIVFLFSDGQVNAGEQNRDNIFADVKKMVSAGVRCTTFGIGDDHDEKIMSGIALNGESSFHYIDTPERIPLLIQKALSGAQYVLTNNGKLRVCGLNGAQITSCAKKPVSPDEDVKIGIVREQSIINVPFEVKITGNNQSIYCELDVNEFGPDDLKVTTTDPITSYARDNRVLQLTCDIPTSSFEQWRSKSITPNRRVECYYIISDLDDLSDLIATMIIERKPIDQIIEKEKELVEKLKEIVDDDDTQIARAMMLKAQADLDRHISSRTLTQHDTKLSCAKQTKYQQHRKEECDQDMGFGLFD
ncbi:vWA-like protein [Yasminevirus sp. GU-2018]|uniref:VWA-like protein n=1 Tax=Yasminevirus sp. GU-2018 TaxID=2420051 RepID=A0A5K0UBG1_9VIRU|nr:vWA-like protein [Yasminevirus sp. GU-2018]